MGFDPVMPCHTLPRVRHRHADSSSGSPVAPLRLLAGSALLAAAAVAAAAALRLEPSPPSSPQGARLRAAHCRACGPALLLPRPLRRGLPASRGALPGRTGAAVRGHAALSVLSALPRPGPFLLFEDLKERRPPRRAKRRRGKLWIYEGGRWERLRPEASPEQAGAETEPSGDARGLADQLGDSKEARRLLAFLENALPSPAFGAEHVALSLHQLAVQRCTLNASTMDALKDRQVLQALALRGKELLEAEEAEHLSAGLVALALRAVAIYRLEVPQLRPLISPLAGLAAKKAAEMSPKQVACIVWAAAELWVLEPEMLDALLPLLADRRLLLWARTDLQRHGREDLSMLENGLLKLRKEVPFLRQVLPA